MSKILVAVVMGGPSAEHEISLKSGASILSNIDKERFEPIAVTISRDRVWDVEGYKKVGATEAMEYFQRRDITLFIALHGSYGEDGTIQALCELYGVKYTGSSVAASLLAMDKVSAEEIYKSNGLLAPNSVSFTQDQDRDRILNAINDGLQLPLVIKPSRQGSSVGVSIVKLDSDLVKAVDNALKYDQVGIAQEFIEGKEVSCGVLKQQGALVALPPTELRPVKSEFFDYEAKYTPGGTEEITPPAGMHADVIMNIQDTAIKCHESLGCGSYSRTDMIIRGNDTYVIETNTLPGFTETSIFPQQAKAAGLSYTDVLTCILEQAQV